MTSNPSTHLNRQYGPIDSLIYDNKMTNTKYVYRGYHTETARWKEHKTLLPRDRGVILGSNSTFEIPIHADKIGPQQLQFTIQSPVDVAADSTFARLTDWAGLACIEKLVWKYGTDTVYTHYPQKKFYRIVKHSNAEKQAIDAKLLLGNLPQVQRDILATAPQLVIYDIPWPWTLSPDRYQEIKQLSLSPILEVHWNKAQEFLQTDGSNVTIDITDVSLVNYSVYFEPQERDMHTGITETNHGVVRLTEETAMEIQPTTSFTIPAGTTGEYSIELKNWKTTLRFFWFWLTLSSDTIVPYQKKPYETGSYYMNWKRFRLISGGGEETILDWMTPLYNMYILHKMYYHSLPGIPLIFWTWDDNPMDESNAHGGYNLQAVLNPRLVIDFGTDPTPEDIFLHLGYSKWQMLQTVKGQVAAQFA